MLFFDPGGNFRGGVGHRGFEIIDLTLFGCHLILKSLELYEE